MTPPTDEERLTEVLQRAQAEGALGSWPISEVIAHARAFVSALPHDTRTVLDLGSGAGVPGLVIALDLPQVQVTLVDRRDKRVDALQRAVARLGWSERVTALSADVAELAADPRWQGSQDAVVARGFGPPEITLRFAAKLTRIGGVVVISEPPSDTPSRWESSLCVECGVGTPERLDRVVRFHVEHHP
ncbi:MAG: RsmG family class I SAM-dependent methyltransferase [Ilumatobacteraceae bacterium]